MTANLTKQVMGRQSEVEFQTETSTAILAIEDAMLDSSDWPSACERETRRRVSKHKQADKNSERKNTEIEFGQEIRLQHVKL
jgi:hypothetical protein